MSTCAIFNVLFGAWAAWMTVLYLIADTQRGERNGWIVRTQNEINYIRRRHPDLWEKVAVALALRYLDEGDFDNVQREN